MGDFLKNLNADQKGALVTQALKLAPAIISFGAAKKAKEQQRQYLNDITKLEKNRQQLTNPFINLSNPYANLSVATKAAEMQAEQTDIALANTLDSLRKTGAGGATALAQAALKSKQGIAASIEQQEVANEKLRAQGQMQVDIAKAKGESWKIGMQERREEIQLDRLQSLADLEAQRRAEAFGTGIEALTSAAGGAVNALIKPSILSEEDRKLQRQLRRQMRKDGATSGGAMEQARRDAGITGNEGTGRKAGDPIGADDDASLPTLLDEGPIPQLQIDMNESQNFIDPQIPKDDAPLPALLDDELLPDAMYPITFPTGVNPSGSPLPDPFSALPYLGYDLGQTTTDPTTGLKITD
jgi:hypothetical protein